MRTHAWMVGALAGALLASVGCTKLLGIDKDYVETKDTAGTSSGTGGSSSSSTSGTGGAGGMPMIPCSDATDCPGKENECVHRACKAGLCAPDFTPSGTAVSQQNVGDCKKIVCDGHGGLAEENDDADQPDDSNPCTKDLCAGGVADHLPAAVGTSCGGTLTCDGNGKCTGCSSPADCPGSDTECQKRSCTNNVCDFVYTPAGSAVSQQTPGDCKKDVCNGQGQVSTILDANDVQDDGNPCTSDSCSNGSPAHNDTAAGAPCGPNGDKVCDGSGACVECLMASSCPGQDDECQSRTCTNGTCGKSFQPSGTMVSVQASGDCKKSVCDGSGGITAAPDDADVQDDGNPCTTDSCSGGSPVHDPVAAGTTCGPSKMCNGSGACVGCITASDCPGTDNACQSRKCTSGVCGMSYVASGTAVGAQTTGDCKKNACDGAGKIVAMVDNADLPVDGNACTKDVCSNGTPSNPPSAAGTACGTSGVCNGAGTCGVCVPGDIKFCCGVKTPACCELNPELMSKSTDVSDADEVPDLACCCGGTQDCTSDGAWGACY